jgi:hypothetical protein
MLRRTTSRPALLALALAAGLALAPLAPAGARVHGLAPRRNSVVQPRLEEPGLLATLWTMLTSLWGEDSSRLDPFG